MTALTKDPQKRFASVTAFATALEQASQSANFHPPTPFSAVVAPFNQPSSSPNATTFIPPGQLPPTVDAITPPNPTLQSTNVVTPPNQRPQPTTAITPPHVPPGLPPPPSGPSREAPYYAQPIPGQITQRADPTQFPQVRKNPNFPLIIAALFLLAVLAGGSFFFFSRSSNNSNTGNSTGGTVTTSNGNASPGVQNNTANTFVAEWQKLGGTVLGHSSEPSTTTSYISLLTQIASQHPDVIYFGGLYSTGGTLIRQQMRQIPGLQNTPFASDDGIVTPNFASTIGLSGGPVYGTVAVVDTTTSSSAANFRNQYAAVYGSSNLKAYSAAGYDATNILIQAIKLALINGAHTPQNSSDTTGAQTFRQAVISAIQGISYNGVTGHQAFDSNGDTTNKFISMYQLALVDNNPGWKYITGVTVS